MSIIEVSDGTAYPLGATYDGKGTNFSLFSANAEKVELCLNKKDEEILKRFRKLISPDKPIYDKPSTKSKKFTIHSKQIAKHFKDLFRMTTNNKSKEMQFPNENIFSAYGVVSSAVVSPASYALFSHWSVKLSLCLYPHSLKQIPFLFFLISSVHRLF